jgi:hypothetical protein
MRDAIRVTEESGKQSGLFQDRTGTTRASIRGELQTTRSGFVSFGGASRFLDGGTRAHVIVGKPILRFVVNGETMFRRMVHHPGTAERPFVRQARERGAQALAYAAEFFVAEAIRRA